MPSILACLGLDNNNLDAPTYIVGEGGDRVIAVPIISGINKQNNIRYTEPLNSYFESLECVAKGTNLVLIIGYGGSDEHINKVLREIIKHDKSRIVYVSSNPCTVAPPVGLKKIFPTEYNNHRLNDGRWLLHHDRVLAIGGGFPMEGELLVALNHLRAP
ncbi:MAG: hypothetical protein KGI54_04065 [Pseudomonadota bacterium]|nr:hypothetical protein [Pseudomonadota bacterium]